VLSRDAPPEIWMKARLYREWAKPQGIVDTVQVMVLRYPGRIGVLYVDRHDSVGPVAEFDIAVVRLLARRAVAFACKMRCPAATMMTPALR
jgi:hypothetical protein